jgi:hypothetical protein
VLHDEVAQQVVVLEAAAEARCADHLGFSV